ncbi:MAG: STAS domain-containing protein [Candidatus Poribacteria bacterium]
MIQIRKPDISFETKAEGDVQILDISGQLDAFTVSDLKNELKKLTDARISKIILNLSKISYANSTAIGAIVATAQQLRKRKGDLKVCGMSDDIRKVFDLVGASKILEIFKTEQEALKSFS